MPAVIIVDTSVFLNVLNVPGFNQHHQRVMAELAAFIANSKTNLLLPMAAIFETGNHIGQLPDGGRRRQYAEIFSKQVSAAVHGNAPWTTTPIPEPSLLIEWLDCFPDHAILGRGLGDLSIIKEWDAACVRHPRHRVMIWSLDGDLAGFDRFP